MNMFVAIIALSLSGSFLCSITEAALYSIPYSRIETLRRFRAPGGRILAFLSQNLDAPIAVILAMNTIFNVMGGVWAGALVVIHCGDKWLMPFSLAFTAAVLLFSEIVPKSLGVRYADLLAPRMARPLQAMVWVLWPYVKVTGMLTGLLGKSTRIAPPTEEDIISTALLGVAGGKILPQEARWVRNALRLNDVKTRDIMTPYSRIRRVPDKLTLSMTKVDAGHWRFSRILVCKDSAPDTILGVVYRHTVFSAMLKDRPDTTMAELMRPIHFVGDDMPADELLNLFIRRKAQIACVRDHTGRLAGVVTLEDVLVNIIEFRGH